MAALRVMGCSQQLSLHHLHLQVGSERSYQASPGGHLQVGSERSHQASPEGQTVLFLGPLLQGGILFTCP